MTEGSSLHNGTHISMPYADVHINITRTLSTINVILTSEFYIQTNITQNATLAYVSPSQLGNAEYSEEYHHLNIFGNGSIINYAIVEYYDFIESGFTDDFYRDYPFISLPVNFAVFTIKLLANTTLVLTTNSGESFDANVERFDYSYIVGSALTFEGHTMERVQMKVIEEMPFLTKSFHPNDSLSIETHNRITDALWEFNVTEFSDSSVGFTAKMNYAIDILSIASTSVVIVLIILLVYQFIYRKSKCSALG